MEANELPLSGGFPRLFYRIAGFDVMVPEKGAHAVCDSFMGSGALVRITGCFGCVDCKTQAMPIVVTGHVLLGMMIFWGLSWLYLRLDPLVSVSKSRTGFANFARFAMLVLFLQTVLGVWTSTNYAALACAGFPQCNGAWWPEADYQGALNLFNGLITGYSGVIPYDAQVAAHWLHRIGALVSFILLSLVMLSATSENCPKPVRKAGLLLSLLLFVQVVMGIVSVKLAMPLWAVVAHNAFSALLMLPLVAISFYSRYVYAEAPQPVVVEAPAGVVAEEVYVEPPAESLYLRLKSQLKRTRSGLSGVLATIPLGQKGIDEDLLEEIEARLLMADVGMDATTEIIKRLTERVERHQLNDSAALSSALKQELLAMLQPCSQPLAYP